MGFISVIRGRLPSTLFNVTRMASSANPLVSADQLKTLIENKKVKILDATFSVDPKPDWKQFREEYYGNFDKLMKTFVRENYTKEHIHNAVLFNMDIAMFPGEFQRYALYPPEMFEKYVQLVGINNDDHVVVYGRGPMSGMLFSAKVWWLLKYYGLDNVQVLNGGIEAWKSAGHPIDGNTVTVEKGNFTAKVNPQMLMTFEQLEEKGGDGKALIDTLNTVNFLDNRARAMYTGDKPQAFSKPVPGFHLRGAKSLPAAEMFDAHGLKPVAKLEKLLHAANYEQGKLTITSCATGIQAAVATLALSSMGINDVHLYHGSMVEMSLRDPSRISEK